MAHRRIMMAAMIACAGIAVPALAQDSVSNNPSPQGVGDSDAINPWGADQDVNYILNLTPFTSSWGTTYATAPLAKSSRSASAFESTLMSAQTISRNVIDGDAAAMYSAWNVAGQGVNSTENDAASAASGPVDGLKQFGFAFSEFATSDSAMNVNQVIGGTASVFANNSCKLYVNRVVAATNSVDGTGNSAQFGLGAVDAAGNVVLRADDFGITGPDPISGQNVVIVDTQARSGGPNVISGLGASDAAASTFAVSGNTTTYSTPNLLPTELGGPTYMGTNFDSQYAFGVGPNLDAGIVPGEQTRGNLAFSSAPLLGVANGVASAATIQSTNADGTRSISIWDVDSTGARVGAISIYNAPATFDDPCTTDESFPNSGLGGWNAGWDSFDHYHGTVAFRGGNSPIALGQDQSGALLAAGIAYFNGGTLDNTNGIAVLRDTDPGAPGGETWSLAAWNGDPNFTTTGAGRGKAVLDGPGGNAIGYMSNMEEATDFAIQGPSMSGCSIDAVGNIWFVAPVEYPETEIGPFDLIDLTTIHNTLIRGVYNPNGGGAGIPCWELEAIMKSGDVFSGANSDTDFLVGFISIVNGAGGASSGTFWSQNASQDAYAGMSTLGMDTSDARSTAGVLLSCSIVYDTDGDEMFSFDSEMAADDDESYNVIMYVGANTGNCADLNNDNVIDTADLGTLIGQFGTAGALGDLNCDGIVDTADLGTLIGAFGTNCN